MVVGPPVGVGGSRVGGPGRGRTPEPAADDDHAAGVPRGKAYVRRLQESLVEQPELGIAVARSLGLEHIAEDLLERDDGWKVWPGSDPMDRLAPDPASTDPPAGKVDAGHLGPGPAQSRPSWPTDCRPSCSISGRHSAWACSSSGAIWSCSASERFGPIRQLRTRSAGPTMYPATLASSLAGSWPASPAMTPAMSGAGRFWDNFHLPSQGRDERPRCRRWPANCFR